MKIIPVIIHRFSKTKIPRPPIGLLKPSRTDDRFVKSRIPPISGPRKYEKKLLKMEKVKVKHHPENKIRKTTKKARRTPTKE